MRTWSCSTDRVRAMATIPSDSVRSRSVPGTPDESGKLRAGRAPLPAGYFIST